MLAIVLYNHRQFGMTARAVWLFQTESTKYNIEFLEKSSIRKYSVDEKSVMLAELSEKNADNHLFSKYGRKKFSTVRDFLLKVSDTDVEKFIRPHIEKINAELITEAINQQISIYNKELQYLNRNDLLSVKKQNVNFEFSFFLRDDGMTYSLTLLDEGKSIDLFGKEFTIISNSPAVFILDKKLFIVEPLRSIMIKTFTTKKSVEVPQRVIKTYFETYILKILAHYDAKASGFQIITRQISPTLEMVVKEGISQDYEIDVYFVYDAVKISCDLPYTRYIVDSMKGMNIYRFQRQTEWERTTLTQISELGLKRVSGSVFVPVKGFYNVFSWVNSNRETIDNLGITIVLPATLQNVFTGKFSKDIVTAKGIDWFEINGVIRFGEFEIPFIKLRKYILNNIREFILPNGQIAYLPNELFTQLCPVFEMGKLFDDKIMVNRFQGEMLLLSGFDVKKEEIDSIVDATSQLDPPEMPVTLRDYQIKGFQWLTNLQKFNIGGILADDMGLGKTLQTIALLLSYYSKTEVAKSEKVGANIQLNLFESPVETACRKNPSLIVVPASLTENWKIELQKFAPSLRVLIFMGQQRELLRRKISDYHVVITSYGTIRNDIEKLSQTGFDYIILDESQMIKNPESVTYSAVCELNGKYRVTLTGTPIENSLTDLWAQLEFINPGYLGSLKYFKNRFAVEIEKNRNEVRSEELQKLISPFILRRTKAEVAKELPPKIEQTIFCSMTEEQEKLYTEELSAVRNEYMKLIEGENSWARSKIFAFTELMNLRLLANDPRIAGHSNFETSGKYMVVTSHLDELQAENHKVLVFSSFVRQLNLYQEYCQKSGYAFLSLTGKTPQKERHSIVQEFQTNSEIPFFFISLKSGGFGLNLQVADYVMLLDPWWNPQAENQAIDRAHRIGQNKHVHVYRYISKETVEEKIQILQERKRGLSNEIIDSNTLLRSFDIDELKNLLS